MKSQPHLVILNYDAFMNAAESEIVSDSGSILFDLLKHIQAKENYRLVIISKENKETIEKEFGELNCILIAENGALVKNNLGWNTLFSGNTFWKNNLKPLFSSVMQNYPDAFLEEKEYSLVLNLRNVDPQAGINHIEQFKKTLANIVHFYNLKIITHEKTIEVVSMEISRTKAIRQILNSEAYASVYVLCEEMTEEDAPENTISTRKDVPIFEKEYDLSKAIQILQKISQ